MPTDPRIDAYIARQAEFAQPILTEIRARVHAACPEAEEALKWSMPGFVYKGKILAVMAGFKAHATLAMWKREGAGEVEVPAGREQAMGQFGKLRSVEDLPEPPAFAAIIAEAMALIDAGAKSPVTRKAKGDDPGVPYDLAAALDAAPGARAGFEALPPGARREYAEWVAEAKRAETRAKRIATVAAQAAEGKKLHWKYEAC